MAKNVCKRWRWGEVLEFDKFLLLESDCCKSYKLIFMDINMPIMDGFEATVEIIK